MSSSINIEVDVDWSVICDVKAILVKEFTSEEILCLCASTFAALCEANIHYRIEYTRVDEREVFDHINKEKVGVNKLISSVNKLQKEREDAKNRKEVETSTTSENTPKTDYGSDSGGGTP